MRHNAIRMLSPKSVDKFVNRLDMRSVDMTLQFSDVRRIGTPLTG